MWAHSLKGLEGARGSRTEVAARLLINDDRGQRQIGCSPAAQWQGESAEQALGMPNINCKVPLTP